MVFFVRITVNQSHLRPICKSTKFNPKIQRTIYSINFQRLRLHVMDFIRTVVKDNKKVLITAQKSFFLRLLGCYKHFFGYFLLDKQAYIGKMSTSYEVDTPVRHSVGVLPVFSLKIL